MPNLLHAQGGQRYDQIYDLKGSSANRFVTQAEASVDGAVLKGRRLLVPLPSLSSSFLPSSALLSTLSLLSSFCVTCETQHRHSPRAKSECHTHARRPLSHPDLNFLNSKVSVRKVLGAQRARDELAQIERDALFLKSVDVIDYSLLLAVGVVEGAAAKSSSGKEAAPSTTTTTDELSILRAAAVRKYSMDRRALRIPETFAGILEANVTSFDHEAGATFYLVTVQMVRGGGQGKKKTKWKVAQRYSAFASLRQDLLQELRSTNTQATVARLPFPSKTLFRPVRDDALSEERMKVLNRWLHCITVIFKGMVGRVECLRRFLAESGLSRAAAASTTAATKSKGARAIRGATKRRANSSSVVKYKGRNVIVALGIIDIFQRFTMTKSLEHVLKTSLIPAEAADTVSVQDPDAYCERFRAFMRVVFEVCEI